MLTFANLRLTFVSSSSKHCSALCVDGVVAAGGDPHPDAGGPEAAQHRAGRQVRGPRPGLYCTVLYCAVLCCTVLWPPPRSPPTASRTPSSTSSGRTPPRPWARSAPRCPPSPRPGGGTSSTRPSRGPSTSVCPPRSRR